MDSTKLSVLLVSLVLVLGLGMYVYSFQSDSLTVTGATITATSGRQCDDTDNNNPRSGAGAEQERTDSVWVRGGVQTRVNSRARWSSIDYDICAGSTVLREKYCDSGARKISEDVICAYGCTSGKCNLPPCTDSDGVNYATVGTATGFLSTYRPLGVPPDQTARSYTDTCASSSTVKEYKCTSGQVREESKACSSVGSGFTCQSGRCAAPVVPCIDSDGENSPLVFGNVGLSGSSLRVDDICASSTSLIERTCLSNGTIFSADVDCTAYGSNYVCRGGVCAPPLETICDGLDDNGNGVIDEGCDDDNDDYCDSTMTRVSPYSCTGSTNCCSLGGGDCEDGYSTMDASFRIYANIHPNAIEDCFTGADDNCNGQNNENCEPYTCVDTDPSNDPYVGGRVTYTSATGQVNTSYRLNTTTNRYFVDSCQVNSDYGGRYTPFLNQTNCGILTAFNARYSYYTGDTTTTCPTGTTCSDPDGVIGSTPAVCA